MKSIVLLAAMTVIAGAGYAADAGPEGPSGYSGSCGHPADYARQDGARANNNDSATHPAKYRRRP